MDKIERLLKERAEVELQLEKMRVPLTILFSDIRGSTSFFEAEGDMQGLAMVDRHNSVLFPVIQQNAGRVVKTIGDAIMASFDKPGNALRAAIGMQQALAVHNQGRGPNQQIHIRIGVHEGLGLVKNGDVYGDVVNTASRVEGRSEPDQIFISKTLVDDAQSLGVNVISVGAVELKGKSETLDLFKLDWTNYKPSALAASKAGKKPVASWVIAAMIVLIAVGAGIITLRKPQTVAPAQAVMTAVNEAPSAIGVTAAQLSELLLQSASVKSALEKAGKPVSALRGLDGAAPDKSITRAELAFAFEDLVIFQTSNRDLATKYLDNDSPFDDVRPNQPAFNAIMTVSTLHLLSGRDEKHFAPIDPATPAEVRSALNAFENSATR